MKHLPLAGVLLVLMTSLGAATNDDSMIDACRNYAASHLNADAGKINVSVQTARVDGTIPVNGDVEGSGITFQCTFNPAGSRIVHWSNTAPDDCPPDVSEADRYLYPNCE